MIKIFILKNIFLNKFTQKNILNKIYKTNKKKIIKPKF